MALGAPDRRLATLAGDYERLVAGVRWPDRAGERARLKRLVPGRLTRCARGSAQLGIPETIQHDDLHDGQVFVRDGTYLFFDWGDSCVSHPFFSMSVTLEGVLAWGLDDVDGSVDITPFRDAYLRAVRARTRLDPSSRRRSRPRSGSDGSVVPSTSTGRPQ